MDEKPYKIVLAGKHRVGKTSIFRALQNFGERSRSSDGGMYTIETGTGISSRQAREKWMVHMLVRNSEVTVILWDTGGMEQHGYLNITRSYFTKSRAVILVYDVGDRASLDELSDWVKTARGYIRDGNVIFSLWGNDTGNELNLVEESAVRDFAQMHGIATSLIFDVNASTGDSLLTSLKQVVAAVHLSTTNPRQASELYQPPCITLTDGAPHKPWWKSCCNL